MMDFYDFDPPAKQQASPASIERVKDGFRKLGDALQAQVDVERQEDNERRLKLFRDMAYNISNREGFFVPPGGDCMISPILAKKLGVKTPDA